MFLLRKWYFDYLTPDGEYAYVYFAYITLAGRTMRSLTVHVAAPGASPVSRSCLLAGHRESGRGMTDCALALPCGEIRVGDRGCTLFLVRDDFTVNLTFAQGSGGTGAPVEIPAGRKSRIVWMPVALRYTVSGTITLGGTVVEPRGAFGYADTLESTCLPPFVPARMLYWGRAHHPLLDLTYVHAHSRTGESVCSRFYMQNGAGVLSGELTFAPDPAGGGSSGGAAAAGDYVITGTAGGGRVNARVHRVRPVQDSGFIDQQDVRSPLFRRLIRAFTRDPRGTKYLSRADLSLVVPAGEERIDDLAMIDECVRL